MELVKFNWKRDPEGYAFRDEYVSPEIGELRVLRGRSGKVETIRPPEGKDFNDLLREKAPASMLAKEARDVVA